VIVVVATCPAGYRHAARWRELGWDDVGQLQRPQVVIALRQRDLAAWPEGSKLRHRVGVALHRPDPPSGLRPRRPAGIQAARSAGIGQVIAVEREGTIGTLHAAGPDLVADGENPQRLASSQDCSRIPPKKADISLSESRSRTQIPVDKREAGVYPLRTVPG
jgi:hypothetical protein